MGSSEIDPLPSPQNGGFFLQVICRKLSRIFFIKKSQERNHHL